MRFDTSSKQRWRERTEWTGVEDERKDCSLPSRGSSSTGATPNTLHFREKHNIRNKGCRRRGPPEMCRSGAEDREPGPFPVSHSASY